MSAEHEPAMEVTSTAPSRDDGESKDGDGHMLAEYDRLKNDKLKKANGDLRKYANLILAELEARISKLKKENEKLRGEGGPENGRFAIATYRIKQWFRVPENATSWYIKWGKLHYRTADNSEYESIDAFDGYNEYDMDTFKRPDAIRCTDEDEDGLWAEYEFHNEELE